MNRAIGLVGAALALVVASCSASGVAEPSRPAVPTGATPAGPIPSAPDTTVAPIPVTTVDPLTTAKAALQAVVNALPERTCLLVRRAGATVFEARPDLALTPASNAKVLTALAVLRNLEPGSRLRTTIKAGARPVAGVLSGDLYLVGGGDPLLATADYAATFERSPEPRTSMEQLADLIVASGLKEIRGSVVGDESRYDKVRYVATWPARYATDRETGPLSALTVNDGFSGYKDPTKVVAVPNPPGYAASVLTDLLKQRGVAISGAPKSATAPPTAVDVTALDSAPLRDIVGEALRESDNTTAELLLKELGRAVGAAPTTDAGVAVLLATMDRLGVPMAGTRVLDGSGLDPKAALTCRTLTGALEVAGYGSDLSNGLALAGQSGTLKKRFADTPLTGRFIAKTGSINGVVTLSGFVPVDQGEPFVFSFMVNSTAPDAALVAYPAWTAVVDTLLAVH